MLSHHIRTGMCGRDDHDGRPLRGSKLWSHFSLFLWTKVNQVMSQ